jgi:hypothetical protein
MNKTLYILVDGIALALFLTIPLFTLKIVLQIIWSQSSAIMEEP